LGAARRDIRRQFFAEALTLSVLGGLAGLVVGFALAALVQAISPLPARVTAWSIGLALLVGIVVGITFGVYPAHRASRLDPIEALRQE
jgi:putative ABC transport system permease protein